jgi:hypothetical protein
MSNWRLIQTSALTDFVKGVVARAGIERRRNRKHDFTEIVFWERVEARRECNDESGVLADLG